MLALGTGALTTTFGLVDAALLRQPPFERADHLAILYMTRTSARAGAPADARRERWSYARLGMLREHATSFETIANHLPITLTLTGTGDPETLTGETVAPEYFRLLRVTPATGRFLLPDENAPGGPAVVVLGWDLWQRRFAADSAILGRAIGVNGLPLTIVGVAPRGFRGLSARAQLWIPTPVAPRLTYAEYLTTNQNFISVVARLRPGVSIGNANAELAVLGPRINAAIPSQQNERGDRMSATAVSLNDARADMATRRSVLVLLVAVALLHLLACANVANLLLGRAAHRRREAAVRAALGAGAKRLFGFFTGEGVVLSLAGGAAGVILAVWASAVIAVPTDVWGPRNFYGSIGTFDEPGFGWRAGVFGAALTLVTTLFVSAVPALGAVRGDLLAHLRAGARGLAPGAGTLRRPSLRGAVVALEAALAVLLLVAGGLMITSFSRMRRTDLGVEPDHVLTFMLRPSEVRVPVQAAPAFLSRLLGAITAVPGVVSATVDGGAPVSGTARSVVHIVGQPVVPDAEAPPVLRHYVAPDHFKTLGMRVLEGRAFTDGDIAGRGKVAIASASAAKRFWPNESAIGKRVWFGSSGTWANADSSAEIVGVVNDAVHEALDQRPNRVEFYTPYAQFTYAWRIFLVRTVGDPAAMVPAVRRAVFSVEPDLPLTEVMTLGERIGASWARHRFDAMLFGIFAALATLLASAGIYAVVAYAVSQRTREMGIRLALGAKPGEIVRLVVREGMTLPIVGLAAGIIAAIATTRMLRASLYEIGPTDPGVMSGAAVMLLAVSALACLAPARRAMKVDVVEALRSE